MYVLQNPVNVVYEVPTSERIEDCRTLDTMILRKIQVVANLFDYFGLTQYVTVGLIVFQTVDVCFHFHNRKPP